MGVSESSNNFGFRVYKLYKDSPLMKAGLRELDDFIVPPNGVNDLNFKEFLLKYKNKTIELTIYNLPSRSFYEVTVTPNLSWGNGTKGSLGGLISYENYTTAHLNILKILKVNCGSLAHRIGLHPLNDYIVAIKPETENYISLNSKDNDPLSLFSTVIKSNKNVTLYVYNISTGAKSIDMSIGKEILGCDVGYSKENELPICNNTYKADLTFTFTDSLAESIILMSKESDEMISQDNSKQGCDISPIINKSLNNSNNMCFHNKTFSSLSSSDSV